MTAPAPARPTTVIAHLSGRYRGKIHRLAGDTLRIGTGETAEIRFSADDLTPGLSELPAHGPYAVLERQDDGYLLRAAAEADIWVNGRRVEQRLLGSGDVIEVGEGGPVLRYRVYPPGSRAYKSVSEVFADCVECVRHGRSTMDRAGVLLAGPPKELLTRTSPAVRVAVLVLMLLLATAVAALWVRSDRLEEELQAESRVVEGLSELLDAETVSEDDVDVLREELAESLTRIEALEERSGARGRVIESSARSVAFIQGSWGFVDEQGRLLRFEDTGPDGPSRFGGPSVTLEGDGPPVEVFYTGTAFVVSPDGQLLTNRHVARPWEYDSTTQLLAEEGLTPVMRRFIGYLPDSTEPFDVELIRASETLDVALLRCQHGVERMPTLQLAESPPRPGDEIIVMGYPTGINALLARADPEQVRTILETEPLDFWLIARQLSDAGLIAPLATVGVIGQVSSSSVVYDAETTHGGSGGPVLNLDGRVLAVNAAILPQFGGSNMGVPAAEALRLLQEPPAEDPSSGTAAP